MQISAQEVSNVRRVAAKPEARKAQTTVSTPADLAERHGVKMAEVELFTESALLAEDAHRERRIRDLARRIAEGTYNVDAEQVVDMAFRRAEADRAVEL